MEIGKLMAVMDTVEEDHRQVAARMQALKEALISLSQTNNPRSVLRQVHEANAGFAKRFAHHAREEESTLFPFLIENLPDEPDLVNALQKEHEEIIAKFEDFDNCVEMGEELDEVLPRTILLDVLAFGWELLDQMDLHAHHETSAVQRCLSRFGSHKMASSS